MMDLVFIQALDVLQMQIKPLSHGWGQNSRCGPTRLQPRNVFCKELINLHSRGKFKLFFARQSRKPKCKKWVGGDVLKFCVAQPQTQLRNGSPMFYYVLFDAKKNRGAITDFSQRRQRWMPLRKENDIIQ
ncbi:MAG: hypothetical protein GJ677_07590 [Rhodobacteraceae bacterium]|nr:hypothetical protein [Paracoccaceae bacterium]